MMNKTPVFVTITVMIVAAFTGGIGSAAERRGFVLPEMTEAPEQVPVTEAEGAFVAAPGETQRVDAAFIETYANEKEIERLKKLLEKRNRENAVLQEKLKAALDRTTQLEMQIYQRESEDVPQYEVRKGDSLWKIAKRPETYGDPRLWIKIFNANMDRIKDPNVIYPGQLLKIPR